MADLPISVFNPGSITTDAPLNGMLKAGNINLENRPLVKVGSQPGDYGTVFSGNTEVDGNEVLYPHIYNGKKNGPDEAYRRMIETGKNMGVFDSPENAAKAGEYLSQMQGQGYEQKMIEQSANDYIKSVFAGSNNK